MKTILVVEDEHKIARMVQAYLARDGYRVEVAFDGVQGWDMFRTLEPDLVVLDLMLPHRSGLELAQKMRSASTVPIVMLTARAEEADRVAGLEMGADDYVTKPFSLRELAARVRAVFRRVDAEPASEVVEVGPLAVDMAAREVRVDGRPIELTPTEFDLLAYLVQHPGRALSRRELMEAIQERAYASLTRTIDSHMKNLRYKIESDPKDPEYILTVHGVGYKFRREADGPCRSAGG
ncbi:MAG: response regulator transcription factor [Candidatus Bipolaricaulota bacterium]